MQALEGPDSGSLEFLCFQSEVCWSENYQDSVAYVVSSAENSVRKTFETSVLIRSRLERLKPEEAEHLVSALGDKWVD